MDLIGKTIGKIRIKHLIGRGAMGCVYQGFHEKLGRAVAVKAIFKDQPILEITRARFLREARLLSSLDHPNICKIHDYLEEEECDLLVLELIEGQSLRDYLSKPHSQTELLGLVRQLVAAVVAAHAKGIVHRDLKPDNVMITHGGILKVLDFGLSRIEVEQPLSLPNSAEADTPDPLGQLLTQTGILMGTLHYMSPEQARGELATFASDIYGLGLLIQEILTGIPPFEPGQNFATVLRKAGTGETQQVVGQPEPIVHLIHRLKAVEPQSRPTAQDVMERLDWILTAPQRKRRKVLTWSVLGGLLIFAVVTTWQSFQIRQAVEAAKVSASNAKQVSNFLVDLFEQMDPSLVQSNKLTARELLSLGENRLKDLAGQPQALARIKLTMGSIYRKLGMDAQAETQLLEALKLFRQAPTLQPLDLSETLLEIALLRVNQDQFEPAMVAASEGLALREGIEGKDQPSVAEALIVMAQIQAHQFKFPDALELAKRAVAIQRTHLSEDQSGLGSALATYGSILDYSGDDHQAAVVLEEAVERLEKGQDQLLLIDALISLGKVYSQENEIEPSNEVYQRALTMTRAALGEQNNRVGDIYNNLAVLLDNQGKLEESLVYFQKAADMYLQLFGENHTQVAKAYSNIALTQAELGHFDEAIILIRKALAIDEVVHGPDSPTSSYDYLALAHAELGLGQHEKARKSYRHSLEITRQKGGNRELIAISAFNLAQYFGTHQQDLDAVTLYKGAAEIWEQVPDPNFENQAVIYEMLAGYSRKQGKEQEAQELQRRAQEYRDKNQSKAGI